METQPIIMVQISDRAWTMEALHQACVMARNSQAILVLLQMVAVQHPGWLGTDLGNANFTRQGRMALKEYEATLEDYGVDYSTLTFQYESLVEGIAQATERVNAQAVFVHIPQSGIPFWTRFQKWSLQRQLVRQHCQWYEYPLDDLESSEIAAEATPRIHVLAQRSH
jgi:hypothetical protein